MTLFSRKLSAYQIKEMQDQNTLQYLSNVLNNMPEDWLRLTTHRLDIYNEELAKTEFLQEFETLYKSNTSDTNALAELPTAYDYIRLGHPLSSILEWGVAKELNIEANQVISFQSLTIPILAILRTNLLKGIKTQLVFKSNVPEYFDAKLINKVYGYNFEVKEVSEPSQISKFGGATVYISEEEIVGATSLHSEVDFHISLHSHLGSVLIVQGDNTNDYISSIQHVRRRETISMTPSNAFTALQSFVNNKPFNSTLPDVEANKISVQSTLKDITNTTTTPLVASSGLSMQYAIMMGLIDDALEKHSGKSIKFIVPPNCYGGTNDQARRVAACLESVDIVDLPVDGENDMVQSLETVLSKIATEDAVPYIIAEIPTNPRVEVPNLQELKKVLSKARYTSDNTAAIAPVFILDQTFCPNVHFLGDNDILSEVKAISYASGSKFPSGGKSTAGYCVANTKAKQVLDKIEVHLTLCDNEATAHQYEILAKQLPSMTKRINEAYKNTREFVNFIKATLPEAKINFVTETLANDGFTPSVFSLDLPTKGETEEEREQHKRALNLKLITTMITKIPTESKFCVSYGQLKGCYWTIPATSTQGTTKEGDKDYIVRASLSPDLDLERHKEVFEEFVEQLD